MRIVPGNAGHTAFRFGRHHGFRRQTMGSNNLTLQSGGTLTISANLSGSGTLSILPGSTSTTIGVNGGTGTLGITNADLGKIQSGFGSIVIGSTSGTGNMDIDAYTWNAPVTFQSSTGNLTFESGTHSTGSNAFLADTGGNITLASGAAFRARRPATPLYWPRAAISSTTRARTRRLPPAAAGGSSIPRKPPRTPTGRAS